MLNYLSESLLKEHIFRYNEALISTLSCRKSSKRLQHWIPNIKIRFTKNWKEPSAKAPQWC